MSSKEISPTKVARILGVHPNTVRKWCNNGKLSVRRDAAKHYWISGDDVRDLAKRVSQSSDPREWFLG